MPIVLLAVSLLFADVSPAPAREPSPQIAAIVRAEARRHGLDPALVMAVIRVESAFNPRALSPKGAIGLMQLMPATARRFGVRDPWDPRQNVRGGCAYLKFLIRRYDGDMRLVFAAYNAGEGAVATYDGVPPFPETRAYVAALTGGDGTRRRAVTATGRVVEWRERRSSPGGNLFRRP